jgi:hypothetical protein
VGQSKKTSCKIRLGEKDSISTGNMVSFYRLTEESKRVCGLYGMTAAGMPEAYNGMITAGVSETYTE